jgi:hypothetical protein
MQRTQMQSDWCDSTGLFKQRDVAFHLQILLLGLYRPPTSLRYGQGAAIGNRGCAVASLRTVIPGAGLCGGATGRSCDVVPWCPFRHGMQDARTDSSLTWESGVGFLRRRCWAGHGGRGAGDGAEVVCDVLPLGCASACVQQETHGRVRL